MRKIEVIRLANGDVNLMVFFTILSEPVNGAGTSFEEMKAMVPLIEKLQSFPGEIGDHLLLEEAEYEILKSRISVYDRFAQNRREFLDMIQAVLDAPKVEVTEA